MATSGVTTLSYSANVIIKQAYLKIGKIKHDTPRVPPHLAGPALELLNMIVKQWESKGLHLWKEETWKVDLKLNRNAYVFGANADSIYKTSFETYTIAAGASADTTIDVKGTTSDISNGDTIAIHLSDDSIHTTTVNGTPSGISGGIRVTLTTALDAALLSGAQVETYVTTTEIPVRIIRAYIHTDTDGSTNGSQVNLHVDVTARQLWQDSASNTLEGIVQDAYFDRGRGAATLRIYPKPSDAGDELIIQVHTQQEIFSSLDDEPDMQPEWYLALVYNLANLLSDEENNLATDRRYKIQKQAKEFLENAQDHDQQLDHINLEADLSDYTYYDQ